MGIWLKTPEITTPARLPMAPPDAIQDGTAPLPEIASREVITDPHEKTPEEVAARETVIAQNAVEAAASASQALRLQQDAVYQQTLQALSSQIAAVQAPLLTDLRAQGYEPEYVSPYAPLVFVRMPKQAIQALNQREDVDTVYGPTNSHDAMNSARPTQKGNWVSDWGFSGTSVKVAILEDNRIEFNNPYIPDGVTRDMGGTTDTHSAATAGMVASTHTTYHGIASGVSLYSANAPGYDDALLATAMDWSVSQGVNVINNSWGGNSGTTNLNVHDRHLDYIVKNSWRTVVVAAGNEADSCGSGTARVDSPARAYNVISVGNYMDNNTIDWSGDAMDACSSYVNPSTGVEKPELSAVGSSITSTTEVSPWIAAVGSGTSYAAPMVSGISALIMERDNGFFLWPKSLKSLLMATALHNIEGNTRLSDIDGAGGVDMAAAFHGADTYSTQGYNTSPTSFPVNKSFYVTSGETVRVAIAWDSTPASSGSSYDPDTLMADLDLLVYDPSGAFVDSSASYNNSFEIVEFTAGATGNYTARISVFRFDGTQEYVGMAWWTGHRNLIAYSPGTWGSVPVSRDYYRVTPGSSYWHVFSTRSPADGDYDISLYQNSAFGNPSAHALLAYSAMGAPVDFVLIDNNHAPLVSYYPEVNIWTTGGSYAAEWAGYAATFDGTYGPYTMTPSSVVRVWDNSVTAGTRKYFVIRPTSGNANLGLSLYASNAANSSTYYQRRSQSVANANSYGAGGAESLNYLPGASDWMGVVAYNNGSTVDTPFYLYVDTSAPTGSFSINNGANYTNTTAVTLNMAGDDGQTGLFQMRYSLDLGSTWSAWEAYASARSVTLSTGDGTKTVYVQFMNNAGMASATLSDTIILDTVLPTGAMTINSGATYTTSANVTLTLSATDDRSNVTQMHLGNVGGYWEPWEAYATSKAWTSIGGDGTKTVAVQYMDGAENISAQINDSIILDTVAPTGTISVNGGAAYTASASVTLTLSASDVTSDMYQMRLSNNGSTWNAWEAYATSKPWTLPAGDGTKTVYVQYKDNAGLASGSFTDAIVLDTTGPTGSVSIEGGAAFVNHTSVNLTLSATDAGSGMGQMRFSVDSGATWSTWEAYATSKSVTLPTGDGTKTVQAQFRDALNNLSAVYSDTIVLDTVLPTGTITINSGAAYSNSATVTLTLSATDDRSGVYQMRFGNAGGSWSAWEANGTSKAWVLNPGDGAQTIYVQFRDNALNISLQYSDSIFVDTTAPSGTITINSGAAYTNNPSVTLTLSAANPGSGMGQMRFSNDGAAWSAWEANALSKTWSLSAGDGTKTVYVQFRDNVQNTSGSFTDTIGLDTTGPTGSVSINAGAAYTATTAVTLTLSASDAGAGPAQMRFSNDGAAWSAWEAYGTSKSWTLTPGDGQKTVFVQYSDNLGNLSAAITDTIRLDAEGPTGSVSINAGVATRTTPQSR